MQLTSDLTAIITALRRGDVIAYPTEGVYGLGCDPLNATAVNTLLTLKQRPPTRGLILVADRWEAVASWTAPIDEEHLVKALTTWPGPITWVFPAAPLTPNWITGNFNSVALRVSKHPTIRAICEAFGGPIVSTSANPHGEPPARDPETVERYFDKDIALLAIGELGGASKPTPIRDVLTDQEIRA